MKVLYAEDYSMDADLLVRSFSRHAPTVDIDVARTYSEALSKLETCTAQNPVYDIVLAADDDRDIDQIRQHFF